MWQWLILLLTINLTYSQQTFTAQIILSNPGTQFVPVNMVAQLISTTLTDSVKKCFMLCMSNVMCRVYDYEVSAPKQCRLFEGDADTLGQIISSSSPQSSAGAIRLSSDLFAEYGSACTSFCYHSRYLQCGTSFTCECMAHTYWDASVSMCLPQSPILGASCEQNKSMCREDLNYTCLQFNRCGPLSILSGTTIMNGTTVISGNSTAGLSVSFGIAVFGTDTDSVIVSDYYLNRVVGIWNIGTTTQSISVVATKWAPGHSLINPSGVYVDVRNGNNLYLSDVGSGQVILYSNMQSVSPPPRIVTGHGGVNGPYGVQVDSHYNLYVAAFNAHCIMFWPPNATNGTNGTVVAGLGTPSNTSMGLNNPYGITLDEHNSWLYVADFNNNRIQRFSLNDPWPANGTTVAGGNGEGSGSNQLNSPADIKLSKKTGAMYIVDCGNNRIQRWEQGATEGVTIAGDPNGNFGNSSNRFILPLALALNNNETQIYVIDTYNYRVQRFQLI